MKYELKTLKDVFDKVPIDRITDCMKELAICLIQAKAVQIDFEFHFPEFLTWIDDDKHEIGLSFFSTKNEKEVLRVETKLRKGDENET